MKDIRDDIFKNILNDKFNAVLTVENNGIFAGSKEAKTYAQEIGIDLKLYFSDGQEVCIGDTIGEIVADPKNMAIAEEKIIGAIAKYSGIATAARKAVVEAEEKVKIVSGSVKKMPPQIKNGIRDAIISGGATFRISDTPMIYMDKNYIKMLGSITKALEAVKDQMNVVKVIQLKGRDHSIEEETRMALENDCGILMVDTGNIEDLKRCITEVNKIGVRNNVKIAFAGDVKINQIKEYIKMGVDILDIGKEIVDAQLLDIKLDVID